MQWLVPLRFPAWLCPGEEVKKGAVSLHLHGCLVRPCRRSTLVLRTEKAAWRITFAVLSADALAMTFRNSRFQARASTASVWLPSFNAGFACITAADSSSESAAAAVYICAIA